ncbi:MAG: ABC transporter ATP-binding protein [Deltaproteobacteria bacterium]|nr:ABC transporter ATP-binding protein [Deltaproteobacteria bacterium]MBW1872090.1 ABC transporter ATP-binding protein [Deltaproteobacteria bacterium]
MEAIVKLQGVTKDYGQGDVIVHALRGVDLELEKGTFAAIAGPSGSGKSTLLNIMSGLDKVTQGQVTVDGRDVTKLSRSALSKLRLNRIGFVFQSYNLLPVLTAYENAEYVLLMQGVSAAERREKVMGLLKAVGLEGMEHRFPRELSGGQQQRVAIARAIASQPALVLADEPTANVDSKTAAALLDLMIKLNEEQGATFLFSTHDENVMKRAKRLIILKDGMIAENGAVSMEELK